jgi:hypothetical protein
VRGLKGSNVGHFLREQQKRIPKVSYRALKATGKNICARRLLLLKQNSYIYFKKEVNVQNISSILVELRNIFRNRGATAMIEYDVYKNVLQRVGWELSRPFLYILVFKKNSLVQS